MLDLFKEDQACSSQRKELRPHQVEALRLVRQSLAQGNRRVLLQGVVGFGKTLVASRIIEGALAKGNGVIFTAPAISLIDQTVKAFEAEGIRDIGVMQADHPRTDPLAKVQVASVQTLAKRRIPDAALVIVDEAHLRAEVIDKLMDERPDLFFIGLSATPWRTGMGLRWQDLVVPVTMQELIDQGFLSRFEVFAPDVPDLSGVKIKAGEYAETALAEVMGEAKLMGHVVQNWLANGDDRPTLAFGVNCDHAQTMRDDFLRAGVSAAYVDAFTDSVERDLINRRFRAGEVRVICSVRTMIAGVDLPVSCLIDAAPTMSLMMHVQRWGRGMRVNPGTEDLKVFDHAGNCLRLGLPTDINITKLDTTPPGKKPQRLPKADKLPSECSKCGALKSGLVCLSCGHEAVPPRSSVEVRDGNLVPLSGKAKPAAMADKQRFFSMALSLARSRGRPDTFAAGLYKGKWGVWPRGMEATCLPPDAAFLNWEKSRRIAYARRMEAQRGAA